jgi:hypothetical protein
LWTRAAELLFPSRYPVAIERRRKPRTKDRFQKQKTVSGKALNNYIRLTFLARAIGPSENFAGVMQEVRARNTTDFS